MATDASTAVSLAQALRAKAAEVRSSNFAKLNSTEKKLQDLKALLEYIKKDAVSKMHSRAEKGCNSANVLEYTYAEYFYVNENNEVVRTPKYVKPTIENTRAYRIFEAIRTNEFKEMLEQYKTEIGDELEFKIWWPGGNINVIEAVWGPTKYHRRENGKYSNNKSFIKRTPDANADANATADAEQSTPVDSTDVKLLSSIMKKLNFNDEDE
jgi:hypothetical protein